MTDEELIKIRQASDAVPERYWVATATPPRWEADESASVGTIGGPGPEETWLAEVFGKDAASNARVEFIAHARAWVPALLDEIDFLKKLLHDRLEESELVAEPEFLRRAVKDVYPEATR